MLHISVNSISYLLILNYQELVVENGSNLRYVFEGSKDDVFDLL